MKRFRVLDYIKKYQIPIVVLSLLAGLLFALYMQSNQTYTASVVINYTNSRAAEGYAPDGSVIDVSEIYSSQAMTRVFEEMGLDYREYNLDELRSRVTVTGIVTDEDKAVQEAVNASGEQSTSQPTKYFVSFTARQSDSDNPQAFARQVLDNLLNIYIENYGEKHINNLMAANDISGLDERNYDYLEMAEILEDSLDDVLVSTNEGFSENNTFRSSANGYSFMDLYREFAYLKDVELSNIYAYILSNRVTKNLDALIAKYENRIENYELDNNANKTQIDAIDRVIASYVEMMKESGNTDITYEYILDDVHDEWEGADQYQKRIDQTVEYDVLMEDFVDNREEYEWQLIEVAYCEYILGIYRNGEDIGTALNIQGIEGTSDPAEAGEDAAVPGEGGEGAAVPGADGQEAAAPGADNKGAGASGEGAKGAEVPTADEKGAVVPGADEKEAAVPPADGQEAAVPGTGGDEAAAEETLPAVTVDYEEPSQEILDTAEAMISELVAKTDRLYEIMMEVNKEYNAFCGAANISLLSNIIVIANQRILLYAAMVVIIFLCLLCVAAVVLGRLGDVVDYYVYRDRKFDLPNRAGCDKYMETYADGMHPDDFGCIVLRLMRIQEKNAVYGREAMDTMMLKFNSMIKGVYPKNDDCFIALNGVGQYIIYAKGMSKEQMDYYAQYLKKETENYNAASDCKIEYECGMAESRTSGIYQIKRLLVQAMNNVRPV